MENIFLFQIIILILSVVIHEVAHGYAALWMGDVTAKYAGRLTMNPVKHLDPIGSIFIPAIMVIFQAPFLIGWAKPVPYNPYNLKNLRWGEVVIAAAGPLSNILIAILTAIFVRVSFLLNLELSSMFLNLAFIVILINLFLAFFNLIPVPPLDGSKILFNLFPRSLITVRRFLETYRFFIIFIFLIFLLDLFAALITKLAVLLFPYILFL